MMTRTSLSLFMIALLPFVNSSTAYSGRTDIAIDETAAITKRILNPKTISNNRVAEPVRSRGPDVDQRGLAEYALYNLDKFSVRFTTRRTTELERVRSSLALDQETREATGAPWTLVSETGGLESSLSYPIRSVTQDYLYIGFQNLFDDWFLELNGGPDGNNDLSYQDFDDRLRSRLLQVIPGARQQIPNRAGQVFNTDGGDSTGEEDYDSQRWYENSRNATVSENEVVVEEDFAETTPAESITDSQPTTEDQQEEESLQTPPTEAPTSALFRNSTEQDQDQLHDSPQTDSTSAASSTKYYNLTQEELQLESPQNQPSPMPSSFDYQSLSRFEQQPFSPQTGSTPVPTALDRPTPGDQQSELPQTESQFQSSSQYVNIYDGLVYHSMYDHLVTVDLRVTLYLRNDGFADDEDSLRRNLRKLQMDNSGEVELLAEMTPTIAFLEPVSEAKRLTKPSNEDVKQHFGVWMEYLFGKQNDVYLRTLREYPNQYLLQEISKLKVDVGVSASPAVTASNSARNSYTEGWSERTQNLLINMVIILGVLAVLWPIFMYAYHMKKNQELSLQLLHGGLSIDMGEGGDDYDFSDSFSSVTYRDNIYDMVKLPPINSNIPAPNSSVTRPQSIERVCSLDGIRHGKDTFPSKGRIDSQNSAISALEASDRYLSRHRPDLYLDQRESETKSCMNIFGRVYKIPSNPFELIYNGGQQQNPQPSLDSAYSTEDLGRAAHFPFASTRSSFTGLPSLAGSKSYTGRSTSVGSTGNNSTGNERHFTPIVVPNQNLAAGICDEDREERDEANRVATTPGIAAHTGHSWQNNNSSLHVHPSSSAEGGGGSVIGNIFRNLSISSWYTDNHLNNSYTSNSKTDQNFFPASSSLTEEVYYDDYHHKYPNPLLLQTEIEMEPLPHGEENQENYDFAFKDFPRKDGTPCLIVDDDSFLSERKRRESAKMIFSIDNEGDGCIKDVAPLLEKKLDDTPVSDEVFKMMLSQNALEINDSILKIEDSDDNIILPPLEGSFLSKDSHDAKSPEFQKKLSRLMDTKRQRYTRENKNAKIVAENQKKRKNVRERERVDRHKAIERELEDIEAEFSLTMQPLSPDRNKNLNNNNNGRLSPKRNTHSPKPPKGGPRYSPMPSRMAASPARKNIATLSPPRPTLNNIAVNSPARSNISRGRVGGTHIRHNSLGGSHRKQNSLGASPFRKFSPRTRYPNDDIISRSAAHRSDSPIGGLADFDSSMTDYKPKFRPTILYGGDRGGGDYDDLSLPSMTNGEKGLQVFDAKFRSPQAVIDEAMQNGAQNSMHHCKRPTRHHQRTLTPSRIKPSHQQLHIQRRTNSLDVNDDSHQRIIRRAPGGHSGHRRSFDVNDDSHHRMIRRTPSGHSGHRRSFDVNDDSHQRMRSRTPSRRSDHRRSFDVNDDSHQRMRSRTPSGRSGHRRTVSSHTRSSSRDEDIFLHGVVAQTRFV